jgi:hypothetical protein
MEGVVLVGGALNLGPVTGGSIRSDPLFGI